MFVPCISLISISSYVVQSTKETGNINTQGMCLHKKMTITMTKSHHLLFNDDDDDDDDDVKTLFKIYNGFANGKL